MVTFPLIAKVENQWWLNQYPKEPNVIEKSYTKSPYKGLKKQQQ